MFSGKFFEELETLSSGRVEHTRENGFLAFLHVLRNDLTPKEIERARTLDALWEKYEGRGHIVANFLPVVERPADVPALF